MGLCTRRALPPPNDPRAGQGFQTGSNSTIPACSVSASPSRPPPSPSTTTTTTPARLLKRPRAARPVERRFGARCKACRAYISFNAGEPWWIVIEIAAMLVLCDLRRDYGTGGISIVWSPCLDALVRGHHASPSSSSSPVSLLLPPSVIRAGRSAQMERRNKLREVHAPNASGEPQIGRAHV